MNNDIRESLDPPGATPLADLAATDDELTTLLTALRKEVETQTGVVNTADSTDPAYSAAASDLVGLLQLTQAAVDSQDRTGQAGRCRRQGRGPRAEEGPEVNLRSHAPPQVCSSLGRGGIRENDDAQHRHRRQRDCDSLDGRGPPGLRASAGNRRWTRPRYRRTQLGRQDRPRFGIAAVGVMPCRPLQNEPVPIAARRSARPHGARQSLLLVDVEEALES